MKFSGTVTVRSKLALKAELIPARKDAARVGGLNWLEIIRLRPASVG